MLDIPSPFNFLFFFYRQTLEAKATTKLEKLRNDAMSCDVIGIDEGQFVREI